MLRGAKALRGATVHVPDGEIEKLNAMPLCRFLLESSPQPTVFVAGEKQITGYANPAFCRLVGKTGAELVGCPFADAAPEGEHKAWAALIDRVYQTGEAESVAKPKYAEKSRNFVSWPCLVWAVRAAEERPSGVMILIRECYEL